MNNSSFVIALVFYFVVLSLITYWVAYQTARVIKVLQEIRTKRSHAQVPVEAMNFQITASAEGLPSERHAVRR